VCLDCCRYVSSNDPLSPLSPAREFETEGVNRQYAISPGSPGGEASANSTSSVSGSESTDSRLNDLATPRYCHRFLEDWTGQLRHFLSFFPDSRDDLIPLRELSQKNQDSISACRSVDVKENLELF
jgi:hypothetical protein